MDGSCVCTTRKITKKKLGGLAAQRARAMLFGGSNPAATRRASCSDAPHRFLILIPSLSNKLGLSSKFGLSSNFSLSSKKDLSSKLDLSSNFSLSSKLGLSSKLVVELALLAWSPWVGPSGPLEPLAPHEPRNLPAPHPPTLRPPQPFRPPDGASHPVKKKRLHIYFPSPYPKNLMLKTLC